MSMMAWAASGKRAVPRKRRRAMLGAERRNPITQRWRRQMPPPMRVPRLRLDFLMTHKYRGCIIVLSINKSVKPNEEQKVLTSGFDQGFTVVMGIWRQ
jgi:hypothetical protein